MIAAKLNIIVHCDEEGKDKVRDALNTLCFLYDDISEIASCDATDNLAQAILVLRNILDKKPIY